MITHVRRSSHEICAMRMLEDLASDDERCSVEDVLEFFVCQESAVQYIPIYSHLNLQECCKQHYMNPENGDPSVAFTGVFYQVSKVMTEEEFVKRAPGWVRDYNMVLSAIDQYVATHESNSSPLSMDAPPQPRGTRRPQPTTGSSRLYRRRNTLNFYQMLPK